VVLVERAFRADHVGRHFQPDPRVDAAVTALVVLVVGVQYHDLVAEEPGGLCPPVSDQGLGRRQIQSELVMQELPDLGLDQLRFLSGAGEAEQPVVRLCRLPDYAAHAPEAVASNRFPGRRRGINQRCLLRPPGVDPQLPGRGHGGLQHEEPSASKSTMDCPSTPAAPLFALTRLYASHTNCFGI
jgi:hypothetical protein